MIRGIITKIDPKRFTKDGSRFYQRIYFKTKDDFYYCDIVSDFRNAKRWQPIIEAGVGTEVKGLELWRGKNINADSFPIIVKRPVEEVVTAGSMEG